MSAQNPVKSVGGQRQEQKTVGGRTLPADSKSANEQAAPANTGSKWAVLIGASVENLKYAHEDAALLYQVLTDPQGADFKPENVYLLVNAEQTGWDLLNFARRLTIPPSWVAAPEEAFDPARHRVALATVPNIERLLAYLAANPVIPTGGTLFFFFSGHGTVMPDESGRDTVYLQIEPRRASGSASVPSEKSVTVSPQPEKPTVGVQQPRVPAPTPTSAWLLPLTRFTEVLVNSPAMTQIVALDACRSGDAIIRDITGLSLRRLFGLSRPPANPNPAYAVLLSCAEGQLSLEDENYIRHGVFAYFLARALQGAADRDGDGKLTIVEMKDYLEYIVPRFTQQYARGFQTPLIGHTAGSASLLDCPTHLRGLTVQVSPPDTTVEIIGGKTIKEMENPEWLKLSVFEDALGWTPTYSMKISHPALGEVRFTVPVVTKGVCTIRADMNATLQKGKRTQKGYRFIVNHPDAGMLLCELPAAYERSRQRKQPIHIAFTGIQQNAPLLQLTTPDGKNWTVNLPTEAMPYDPSQVRFQEIQLRWPDKPESPAEVFIRYHVQIGQVWLPKTWEGQVPLAAPAQQAKR
jgi:uncharacterized caspase-like protein